MMRLITAIAGATLLAGCATTGATGVQLLCDHKDEALIALDLALLKAQEIEDPVKREAAESGIRIAVAAYAKCPQP